MVSSTNPWQAPVDRGPRQEVGEVACRVTRDVLPSNAITSLLSSVEDTSEARAAIAVNVHTAPVWGGEPGACTAGR